MINLKIKSLKEKKKREKQSTDKGFGITDVTGVRSSIPLESRL